MHPLASASLVVLVVMSVLYFLAWALYRQPVFWRIAAAWLANSLYLLFDTSLIGSRPSLPELKLAYAACLPSTYLFLYAYVGLREARSLRHFYGTSLGLKWTIGVAAGFLIPFTLPASLHSWAFELTVLPGALLSAWVLIRLGREVYRRNVRELLLLLRGEELPRRIAAIELDEDIAAQDILDERLRPDVEQAGSIARVALSLSFFAYGAVQIFYLLREDYSTSAFITGIFYAAFGLKALNGVGLVFLLLADFRYVSDNLRQTTVAEELGALTASIEHDIKNPVSNLRKKLRLLKSEFQHDSRVTNSVHFIERQVERIQAAADVIPAMRETEKYYRDRSEVWNLVDLVRTSIKSIKEVFDNRNINIDLQFQASNIQVSGVRPRLIQAIVNILNNAVEASLEINQVAPPQIQVECKFDKTVKKSWVVIRDRGHGIHEKLLPHVVRPLFSTKRGGKPNRGIGLFIADRIIQQHGGILEFESDGESYTCVTIGLPMDKVS